MKLLANCLCEGILKRIHDKDQLLLSLTLFVHIFLKTPL